MYIYLINSTLCLCLIIIIINRLHLTMHQTIGLTHYYMFDYATALCDILYKRLRNTLTYLLSDYWVMDYRTNRLTDYRANGLMD